MNITTKFSIGDKAYPVDTVYEELRVPCVACDGTGKLLDGLGVRSGYCHASGCHQGGHRLRAIHRAKVGSQVTVGKVAIDMYRNPEEEREQYMCDETGVGSGRVYYANRLFATQEEAQAFADTWTIDLSHEAAIAEEKYRKVVKRGKARKQEISNARHEAEVLKAAKEHGKLHDPKCEATWIEPFYNPYGTGDDNRAGFFTHCECAYRREQESAHAG